MRPIPIIWALFVLLFFCLGWFHVSAARKTIPSFEIEAKGSVGKIEGIPVHTGFKNFVEDFNSYVATRNRSSRVQNTLSAIGYFAASLTAIFSMLITMDKVSNSFNKILSRSFFRRDP